MNDNVSEQMPSAPIEDVRDEARPVVNKAKTQSRNKTRSRIVQAVSLLVLILVLLLVWHFLGEKSDKAANKPRSDAVPVEMAAATQRDVPIQIKGIGNVEALSTVAVRSQVEGTLQRVYFTPGQEVKKNDLLFMIDPRPLQAALSQAEANLVKAMAAVAQAQSIVARDQATALNLRIIANRDAKLIEDGVISREEYDNAVSAAQAADATVKADESSVANLQAAVKAEQANVQNSRVQLGYTSIRAPINGKTGNLAITAGNLIPANNTTPLVTITQTAPIYVTFSVPEQDLLRIRQYSSSSAFKVEVVIPGDESHPAQGKLSLLDNTVDTTTGTIRLKATFDNTDERLFPGQFVNVVLTLGTQDQAIVVPSQAVQVGQDNSFVYVVKPDMTTEVRTVKTGTTIENMTVIEDGLKPGEQVVTDGQLRLVPGAKIQPKSGQGAGSPGGKGTQGGGNRNSGSPDNQGGGNQGGKGTSGGGK
jgi:membrane fusion protein, multidrug efflux system